MRTPYDGPFHIEKLEYGGCVVRLARPSDPDRLLLDEEVLDLNAREGAMPYWAYLWPGAHLLAEAVARETWNVGDETLEIGCGLGLAGLAALSKGLRVHFTDYDEAPLDFVARSIQASGLDDAMATLGTLDWREPPPRKYRVILGADVLYEKQIIPVVARFIAAALEPEGNALFAGPYRVATEDLPACLEAHGLVLDSSPVQSRDEKGQSVRGHVHRVRHAKS